MNKILSIISTILIACICMMTSCTSYQDVSYETANKSDINSFHIVSLNELDSICTNVSTLYESNEIVSQSTRSEEDKAQLSAYTCHQISKTTEPLQVSGKAYRDAIIANQNRQDMELNSIVQCQLNEEEIKLLNNLSEEELTMLGMQLSVLSTALDTYNNEPIDDFTPFQISSNKYIDCFFQVTGIATVGGIVSTLSDILEGKFTIQSL